LPHFQSELSFFWRALTKLVLTYATANPEFVIS